MTLLRCQASLAVIILQIILQPIQPSKVWKTASYRQILFNTAAVFTACRRVDLTKTTFDRLVALMNDTTKKILACKKTTKKVKHSQNFIDDLDDGIEINESKISNMVHGSMV